MNEEQAVTLLEKKLDTRGSEVAELAAALEYMPLAIAQAAAYISQRAPRFSVAKYLQKCEQSERKKSSLLAHNDSQLRRDWEAKNSIIVTWQISFEHIQQIRPSAADLLSLMSFFDRQGIPEGLIRKQEWPTYDNNDDDDKVNDKDSDQHDSEDEDSESDEDGSSQSSADDDSFEDDILTLRNFHFISVDTNGTIFEMHALVQLATRTWLIANGRLEEFKQQFIKNLDGEFPDGDVFENWAVCRSLFAHAKAAVEQKPKDKTSLFIWAKLLHHAGAYAAKGIGNSTDAVTLTVKSMEAFKEVLGQEHDYTIRAMQLVGRAYLLESRYHAAEEIESQVLKISKRVCGEEHAETLTRMGNLALTLAKQGRWKEAEDLQLETVEKEKRVLGEEHPETLASTNNLALAF